MSSNSGVPANWTDMLFKEIKMVWSSKFGVQSFGSGRGG
jgi:hypothetical protein